MLQYNIIDSVTIMMPRNWYVLPWLWVQQVKFQMIYSGNSLWFAGCLLNCECRTPRKLFARDYQVLLKLIVYANVVGRHIAHRFIKLISIYKSAHTFDNIEIVHVNIFRVCSVIVLCSCMTFFSVWWETIKCFYHPWIYTQKPCLAPDRFCA